MEAFCFSAVGLITCSSRYHGIRVFQERIIVVVVKPGFVLSSSQQEDRHVQYLILVACIVEQVHRS